VLPLSNLQDGIENSLLSVGDLFFSLSLGLSFLAAFFLFAAFFLDGLLRFGILRLGLWLGLRGLAAWVVGENVTERHI